MRKLIVFTALAAVVVFVPAALAKERNIALAGKPSIATAGQAWTATISVTRDKEPQAGKAPTIRLINLAISSGGVVNITARPTSQVGVYRARVAFPTAGTWRIVVIDRMTGRAYSFGRTRVRAA
jgi:YtkA-like